MDSETMRTMVIRAWEIEKDRYAREGILFNSQLSGARIRRYCRLGTEEEEMLSEAFTALGLSARAHDRILKVARTIADLDGAPDITKRHLAEAISYRQLDRRFFGE